MASVHSHGAFGQRDVEGGGVVVSADHGEAIGVESGVTADLALYMPKNIVTRRTRSTSQSCDQHIVLSGRMGSARHEYSVLVQRLRGKKPEK